MDRMLLERAVALVRSGAMTEGERRAVFKALRVAIASRSLARVGRVEDTINLLGMQRAGSPASCRKALSVGPRRSAARRASRCFWLLASRLGSTSLCANVGARRNLFDLRRAVAIQNIDPARQLLQEAV
ncbi:hypothetical protein [Sorangium sp. So ce426]|uniref:hypothetical protein n=1 Tax=Sorangium sp. So ce426 TaxID=3133312 RepID=UPI003F5B777E